MLRKIFKEIFNFIIYLGSIAIIFIALVCLSSLFTPANSQEIEIRGFSERFISYDKVHHTEMGTDIRLSNETSQVQIKQGVMFSSLKDWKTIGNHSYHYKSIRLYFFLKDNLKIGGTLLKEVIPIEGNDLGLTKPTSLQDMQIGWGKYSLLRGKHTNGNFYSDYKLKFELEKVFTKTEIILLLNTVGLRGQAKYCTLLQDDFNFIEVGIVHWWRFNLREGLQLAFRGSYLLRQYPDELLPGVTLSIGLISK